LIVKISPKSTLSNAASSNGSVAARATRRARDSRTTAANGYNLAPAISRNLRRRQEDRRLASRATATTSSCATNSTDNSTACTTAAGAVEADRDHSRSWSVCLVILNTPSDNRQGRAGASSTVGASSAHETGRAGVQALNRAGDA
jgi:hypothetical protein